MNEIIAAIVSLTAMGAIFGLILSISKIKLIVVKDPKIGMVTEALPGANCGACGMPGCAAYASRIVEEKFSIDLCPVGGAEVAKKIADIMGVEHSGNMVPVKAKVHCQGGIAETVKKFLYNGPKDCTAAHNFMGGYKVCGYGCLGFGNCERSCPFDAIQMSENGLPIIDVEKCVGCGMCVKACPRSIISLVPENFDVYVLCMNKEKAPIMKKGCSVGCIACKLCEKACKEVFADNPAIETAIEVKDFCAVIDYTTCINCYKCAEVCPVPVINPVERSTKVKKKAVASEVEATV